MLSALRQAFNGYKYLKNGNRHSFATNARYRRYLQHCQQQTSDRLGLKPADKQRAAEFKENGFSVFPAALPRDLAAKLKVQVDEAFSDPASCVDLGKGLIRLVDGIDRFPEIMSALQGAAEGALKAFYGSEFKVYSVSVYRTTPNGEDDKSSFLWHLDNCPSQEVKFMVYLDDVSEETGAFRLKPRPLSAQLVKEGFWDRSQIKKFERTLFDDQSTVVFEQQAGDAVLFMNAGCIHKATSPKKAHRDVANFVVIPSDLNWREHYSRNRNLLSTNAGICLDPFTDKPEMIGYRY